MRVKGGVEREMGFGIERKRGWEKYSENARKKERERGGDGQDTDAYQREIFTSEQPNFAASEILSVQPSTWPEDGGGKRVL